MRQVRAELAKVMSTRMVWGLLIGSLAYSAVNLVVLVALAGQETLPELDTEQGQLQLFATGSLGTTFTLVLGVLAVTGEFRHGTITATFLAVPRRSRVIGAKLVALPMVGLGYAALGVGLAAAGGYAVAVWQDIDVSAVAPDVPGVLLGSFVAVTLYAMLGVGFGALIRNQVAAVVAALMWVLLVESTLVAFLPSVGRWTPGGASQAMTLTEPQRGGDLLPPWAGAVLFVGYCVALAALGARTTMRRDIT